MAPCPGPGPGDSEEIDCVAGAEGRRGQACRMSGDRDTVRENAGNPGMRDGGGSSLPFASPAPARASTSCCCGVTAPGWDSCVSCPARLARATAGEGPWAGRPGHDPGHGPSPGLALDHVLDHGSSHAVRRASSLCCPGKGLLVAARGRWSVVSRGNGLSGPGLICHDLCGLRRRGSSQHLELARKLAADGCDGVVAMTVLGAGRRDQIESPGLHRRRPLLESTQCCCSGGQHGVGIFSASEGGNLAE